MVFAAGRGERLWPLTERTPKPLLPVAGRPILERTLKALVKGGIRQIAIVTNYQEEEIRKFVGDGSRLGFQASFVHQNRPLGTGDALRACESWLGGESRFVVIHGDDYYSASGIAKFLHTAKRLPGDSLATAEVDDASLWGRLEIRKGLVQSIHEKAVAEGHARVNAALYMLTDSVFIAVKKTKLSARGEYELTDAVNYMIRGGREFHAFPLGKSEWLGVTYPWDLLDANRRELETSFPVRLGGKVEKGVRIVKPVSVAKGAVIKSGSYVEGPVTIGEDSSIGPNSYLRPFTSIGGNCKVGASCEIKCSILMDGAKVPHLSYVGDSIIGEGSSLGAGTITANLRFDDSNVFSNVRNTWVDSRRRKLGAILGEGVRTGINVSLFPGVKIGAGAWIGPGVVVRRDIGSGEKIRETTPIAPTSRDRDNRHT